MLLGIRDSIVWRLGIALSLVAFMALFGIAASALIAEKLRGAATAINDAGKLRYSTYQASVAALQPEVEAPLEQERALMASVARFDRLFYGDSIARMVPDGAEEPLRQTYAGIDLRWRGEVRPMLVQAIGVVPDAAFYGELRRMVDAFVLEVDHMVHLLEARTEAQVRRLSLLQGGCLLGAIVIIFWAVVFLQRSVSAPLRELVAGATAISRNDFDRRIQYTGRDEFGQLGVAFNLMAKDLSQSYGQLEQRVQAKTRALEQSNRSLELIYRSLTQTHAGGLIRASYAETLRELESLLGLGRICLCLFTPDGHRSVQLADSRCTSDSTAPLCLSTLDPEALGVPRGNLYFSADAADGGVLSALLKDNGHRVALLRVKVPPQVSPEPWQIQLVEAIAGYLTMAITSQKRAIQGRRLSLLEERAAIARELHDSLAQSLSYLKIQVLRVRAARRNPENVEEADAALEDLHEGLTECNRQLRELLTTFRLGIDAESLDAALEDVVADINQSRDRPFVALENRLADAELGVNEEVHVLHIVREALCNVQNHARAAQASVLLEWSSDHEVRVVIDDDGIGITDTSTKPQHFGLAIMRERAAQLGGWLQVGPGPAGGTRVELRFVPEGAAGTLEKTQTESDREEVA